MLLSRVRASSAVPWNANGEPGATLIWDTNHPMINARTALILGSTHNDAVAYSRTASRRIITCSSHWVGVTVRPRTVGGIRTNPTAHAGGRSATSKYRR